MKRRQDLHMNEDSLERMSNLYSGRALLEFNINQTIAENHLLFDRVRRFLDITRALHKRWVYVSKYILSLSDECVLIDVFDEFHIKASISHSISVASCNIFYNKIKNSGNELFVELLDYEDYVNQHPRRHYIYSKDNKDEKNILVPYDLESLYLSIMFYARASAPSFLYKTILTEPGVIYKESV
ncbi:hypothetical protein [Photorhabdus sp. RW14-46]|uniref:hypothetical protein n=1 Tax=Photorhabdus sp. RW14-46 TaxID=2100168 RepID=UPI0013F45D2F|nr:hypothetical protein [Photorhabdus sp. RW14-46]NHB61744.1 hypothetical protein [Photorhabdus sp. RW14-46]